MSLRVGLIGCGWISPFQAEAWRRVEGAELVAVCDRDGTRSRSLADRFGIAWSGDDALRMLTECPLDLVDIATTPDSHKSLTLAALKRGCHVVCQKPAAPSLEDAQVMIEAAEGLGRVLYINEMIRYCPWYRQAGEVLAAGRLGRVAFARIYNRIPGFLPQGPEGRVEYGFRDFLKSEERVIMLEETIHYLDVARYLFGEPSCIYCVTERLSPLVRGEDIANLVLRYDGLTVLIEDSWSACGPPRSGMEMEGSAGSLFLSGGALELFSGARGGVEERWDYSGKSWPQRRPEVFAALYRELLGVIAGRGNGTAQARDNLRTLALTLAAYESAASGEPLYSTATRMAFEPRAR